MGFTSNIIPSVDRPWTKAYSQEALTAALPQCTLYDLLYENNKNHLNETALNYFDRRISYGSLFVEIDKATKAFAALGVHNNDVVIICSVNMPETVYAFYALNRLGAIANMVDPRTGIDTIHDYIKESKARIVLVVDLAYGLFRNVPEEFRPEKVITMSPSDSMPLPIRFAYRLKNKPVILQDGAETYADFIRNGKAFNGAYVLPPYEKDKLAVLAHTGGTTGNPKTVMLSNDNINTVTNNYGYSTVPFKRQQKFFNDLPPFIVYGLALSLHTSLCYGLEMILYPKFDSAGFPKQFAKYKPEHFTGLPDHIRHLIESDITKNMDLSFCITVAVGGDTLDTNLEEAANDFLETHGCRYEVCKGYGMTELSATAFTSMPGYNKLGSVGIPMLSVNARIVDTETGEELPCGSQNIGEIWISSPTIMLGYYKKPKETEKIISVDENGNRWIHTGDLGYMDEEGLLFHVGRIRRIYLTVFNGQPAKIFPTLIEDTIKKTKLVKRVAVVSRKMKHSDYYEPVAFLVLKSKDDLKEMIMPEVDLVCKEQLASYMWPVEYVFVEDLPLTKIGKVDFVTLEQMASDRAADEDEETPASPEPIPSQA